MVTITNGVKIFRIPSGAVKPYEGMGFHVATDEELEEMNQKHYDDSGEPDFVPEFGSNDKEGNSQDDLHDDTKDDVSIKDKAFVEELLEKPLSQWSVDEMKDFVRIKGIDTSAAQKASQVRGIIKAYLDEQNKNA